MDNGNTCSLVSKRRNDDSLTDTSKVIVDFQHYISVQMLLRRIQQSPLVLGEVHSHVLKAHWGLNIAHTWLTTGSATVWTHTCPLAHRSRHASKHWGMQKGSTVAALSHYWVQGIGCAAALPQSSVYSDFYFLSHGPPPGVRNSVNISTQEPACS